MTIFFIIVGTIALVSLGTIVWILIRVWPKLTLLDVASLPEVKESRKKDDILRRRAEIAQVQTAAAAENFFSRLKLLAQSFWQIAQSRFRQSVDALERTLLENRRQKNIEPIGAVERHRQIHDLLVEAQSALDTKAYDAAEKAYIAIISLDPKSLTAYQGLGDVYFAEKHFSEARETYRYVLYLDKRNEHAIIRLAEMAEAEGALETAVEYYQQAVLLNDNLSTRFVKLYELLIQLNQHDTALSAIQQALDLEPQNPKYLDNFIEASILVGDKTMAEDGYRRLRMINPENQKLTIFRERIDKLA